MLGIESPRIKAKLEVIASVAKNDMYAGVNSNG